MNVIASCYVRFLHIKQVRRQWHIAMSRLILSDILVQQQGHGHGSLRPRKYTTNLRLGHNSCHKNPSRFSPRFHSTFLGCADVGLRFECANVSKSFSIFDDSHYRLFRAFEAALQ